MSDEKRDFGTGTLARGRSADFDAAKLAAFLKQYSVDDIAKAFFVLNLWLPNISSLIKLQYLYATLESICAELQESDRLKSFPDYGRFYEELFPLLPSFVALEDFVPEADWGEIKYFFNERYYRVFYGGELLNSYDFCYAFEILYTPLDKAFQAILTRRSPLLDLRHCLEFQDHVLRSIQQDAIEQELNPGDISVPSEEFWLRATRFLEEFNADEVCGSRFVAAYLLDLRERSSAPVEMPRFTADACDGRSCPYLFLKTGRGVYPSMPRRSFCVLNDTWGTLLRKHEEAVTAVLDDKDIQHHMMVGFSRFIAARWRHESLFMPAAAVDEDSSPHETVLIAVRSRNRLFVFHIAPPAISAEALGRYLQNLIQNLTECKRLLLKSPTRLALLGKGYVEFGSDTEGETLSPTFVVGVPWCSTALMSFEIPRDLDAEVMGLDQLCGLIDELENDDELSDFFDYLESLREFHIPPTTTYLDMFGSFRGFHSVLVRGVRMPDIVTFDATWGSSLRFRTLKDFWGRFPEGMFGPHPRSWTIPDERRTKHGLLLSSRELFHIAYFQRVGNASIYINAPAHLMTLDQGMIADSLMHSLADAFELYCPVMERLQFARHNTTVHVMLFPGSLVKESPELKHLLRLIPEGDTWKIDGTRLKPSSYAFRVVYNDDRVKSELEAVVDRRFQMQLLIEVVRRINKIFPGSLDAEVEQELAHENAKPARFTLISFDKHVSFPEGVRPVVPGLKEYKLADRDIAHLANDLGIEPGTHESGSGKEALNRLIDGLVTRIDEYVSEFGLDECLPFLLGRVDGLIAEDDRNRRQVEISLQHEVDYERGAHSSESRGDFLRNYKNYRYLIEKFVQLQSKGTSRPRAPIAAAVPGADRPAPIDVCR